ncbi:MAG: hypothetical protein IT198_16360 [Acidimicrobiia bacterium]|nr:hypothetical protein [Acidimicrobiia bacterium]
MDPDRPSSLCAFQDGDVHLDVLAAESHQAWAEQRDGRSVLFVCCYLVVRGDLLVLDSEHSCSESP